MPLKEKVQEDLKNALKDKRGLELSVLRLLNTAIVNKEKTKRYKISKERPGPSEEVLAKESSLADEEILDVISSEIKKRKEAIILFEKGERMELAEKEKKEVEILQKYLPEQLSEEEIKKLAKEMIEKTGAKQIKDMGKVMTVLSRELKGRADGSTASKIVRDLLQLKND